MLHAARDVNADTAYPQRTTSRRSSRVSAVSSSLHGGADENGAMPTELRTRRKPSAVGSRRASSSSALRRVDEEGDDECDELDVSDVTNDGGLWSARELFSSDEEIENRQVHRRASAVSFSSRKTTASGGKSTTTSRPSSLRPPLQHLPPEDDQRSAHRASRVRSYSASATATAPATTTLDEKKQKKLVALFYWRRQTLEKFLSAWKYVVFEYEPSRVHQQNHHAQRLQEMRLLRPYVASPPSVVSVRPVERSPRHENTLLRNAHQRHQQLREPVSIATAKPSGSKDGALRRTDRIGSLREEYRQLKAQERQQMDPAADNSGREEDRMPFKQRLRVYFQYFELWRSFLENSQAAETLQSQRAATWHAQRLVDRYFHRWATAFMAIRRARSGKWQRARNCGDRHVTRRRFRLWRKWIVWRRRVNAWETVLASIKQTRALRKWRMWMDRTTRLRDAQHAQQRRLQQRYFQRLTMLKLQRERRHHSIRQAQQLYDRHLTRRLWRVWKRSVFESEHALHTNKRVVTVACTLAVSKWKRFIARRRAHHQQALQADAWLYEGLLRRFWIRWLAYLSVQRATAHTIQQALHHKRMHDKRRAVRALLSLRCHSQFERDRGRGARAFYNQRVTQRVLQRWRAHTSELLRVRAWRAQRTRRQVVLCFVVWRQLLRRSQRLHSLHATLTNACRQRLLMRSLSHWRHHQRVCVAFTTVQTKQQRKTRLLYLLAWHKAAAQRRQRRVSIQQNQTKRIQQLQHKLLVAWFSLAMRARCLAKLVRLFQKKHRRKKLQQCLRAFQIYAKLRKFQIQLRKRWIASAWHGWVVYTADRQQTLHSRAKANRFYEERRYGLAVHTWTHNAKTWIHKRQATHKALHHLISNTMRTTLYAWYLITQTRRRQREFVQSQAQHRRQRHLYKCLHAWHKLARRRAKKQEVLVFMRRHALQRRCETSFHVWCGYARDRRSMRRKIMDFQRRQSLRKSRSVLRAWRRVAFWLRKRRRATQLAASHNRRRVTMRVLLVWRVAAAERRQKNTNRAKAIAFHHEFLVLWAFYGWQHASLARQVLREKRHRAAHAATQRRLRAAVSLWRSRLQVHNTEQLCLGRAVHFYRQLRRSKAVRLWRSFLSRRVYDRRTSQRAKTYASAKTLARCLHSWMQFTAGTRTFKLKLRTIFQTGDSDIQRKVMQRWRRYKRSSTLLQRGDAYRKRTLLAAVWRQWRARVVFACKMKANVVVTSRLLQSNILRTTFIQWTQYITRRRQLVDARARGESFYTARCYRLALWRLRVAVRHARAVEISETFHVRHALRHYWRLWLVGITTQRQRRAQKTLAVQTSRRKRIHKVFLVWRGVVKAKQRRVQAKIDGFFHKLALKHTWKAWKRVVYCRNLVQKAHKRRVLSVMRGVWTKWGSFTSEQSQIRRHVDAAVAHLDRATMHKIWQRWLLFLDKRRDAHQQNSKALAFYATRVVLTPCVLAWELFVRQRHAKKAQNQDADVLFTSTVMRKCLAQLEAYMTYRRQRAETIVVQDQAIRQALQKRAIAKWHKRAMDLHTRSGSHTQAIQFYTQRRLTNAVESLVTNRLSKRQQRHDTRRANALRLRRLISSALARWRCFLTWRRRHKHLLRLFRTNQQSDYFTLWRRYVLQSHQKRALQIRATQGYRGILQRNVFSRWHMRCCHWQSKRRAVEWFSRRHTARVFAIWSHRVRILRKMRQLFQFQDAFRLESHFAAWKRYWWSKRQRVVRVQDASLWFVRHRQAKCFTLWRLWLASKRQEKHTLWMAVGFQRRFFSRKYLMAWHGVIAWQRRKQRLWQDAKCHDQRATLRRVWTQLAAVRVVNRRLRVAARDAREALDVLYAQRSVHQWKQQLQLRKACKRLVVIARLHLTRTIVERSWRSFVRWMSSQKTKQGLVNRALAHYAVSSSRRALLAWSSYATRLRQLRHSVYHFKTRYFRSVADECFYEWKDMVQLKHKLRILKSRAQRSRQRQVLSLWNKYTTREREMLSVANKIQQLSREKLLRKCVCHWEVVASDRWMYATLVQVSVQRRRRRLQHQIVEKWKTLVVQRIARKEWRRKSRRRHARWLSGVLHQWRMVACESECGSGDGGDDGGTEDDE